MLVTFFCDAYENITYLGDIAQRLLKMMGHSGTLPGAILAQDVPAALSSLQQGIAKQKGNLISSKLIHDEEEPEISLAHRALPLVNLLEAAKKAECNVMFGDTSKL